MQTGEAANGEGDRAAREITYGDVVAVLLAAWARWRWWRRPAMVLSLSLSLFCFSSFSSLLLLLLLLLLRPLSSLLFYLGSSPFCLFFFSPLPPLFL